jgi:hypothetical protein
MAGRGGAGGSNAGAGGSGGGGGGMAGRGGAAGTSAGVGGGSGTSGTVGTGGSGGTGGAGGTAGRGGSGAGGTAGSGSGGTGGLGGSSTGWGVATSVASSASAERLPSVAADSNGNGVVVFESDGNIYYSRYTYAQQSWSAPAPLASGAYAQPSVAVDGTAHFIAVWTAATGAATTGVWQSTLSPTSNWSAPSPLASTNTGKPVLSMNTDGAAIAAWSERIGGSNNNQQAVARVRDSSGNWLPPQVMLAGDSVADRTPAVVMSPATEAFVVWVQGDPVSTIDEVWYRRLSGGTWTVAVPLAAPAASAQAQSAPAIASNVHGVAIVTYIQKNGTQNVQLVSQRYAGGGFGAPIPVGESPTIDSSQPPSVTLDDNGIATAAWGAGNAQGVYNVQVNRTVPSDGTWSSMPTAAETDDLASDNVAMGRATMPVVRGDGKGNVTLVWRKLVMTGTATHFDLFTKQFMGTGWDGPTKIETDDSNGVFNPSLSVNGSNVAITAWYYANVLDVYANVRR